MKKALLLSILALFSTALHGNDGSYGISGEGGAVIPVKNDAITMRNEQIDIDVYQIDSINFRIDYSCKFYFENTTNIVQEVLVGFPHLLDASMVPNYTGNGPAMVRNPGSPAVSDFVFNVGGKRVNWDVFPAEQNPSLSNVPPYDIVYAVNIGFAPGEKKLISNTYSMSRRHSERRVFWGGDGPGNVQTDFIHYILKTGRTWKGPIGTASITVTFHVPDDYFTIVAKPTGYKIEEHPLMVKYSLKDFTPEEDISINVAYKKQGFDNAVKQMKDSFDRGRYEEVYYLLNKWSETEGKSDKDKKSKDIIRNLAYKTAEKLYNTNFAVVRDLYLIALECSYSYDLDLQYNRSYIPDDVMKREQFEQWEHEGESNSPCYYITYNLACVLTRRNSLADAQKWLSIAYRMKPDLSKLAQNDKDLENLLRTDTPFVDACRNKIKIREEFEKGADINERGKENATPLIAFFQMSSRGFFSHDIETLSFLLGKKPDFSLRDTNNLTALHYAVKSMHKSGYEEGDYDYYCSVLQLFSDAGADMSIPDDRGRTPLMLLLQEYAPPESIIKLIGLTKDINTKDHDGGTALMYFLKNSWTYRMQNEVFSALLRASANVNDADKQGVTPLMLTANIDFEKKLLEMGADAKVKDRSKRNVLMHLLSRDWNEEKIQLLIDAGADPNARDLVGKNAFDLVKGKNGEELLGQLIDHSIHLRSINTGIDSPLWTRGGNSAQIAFLDFRKDGITLLSGNKDGWIKTWGVGSHQLLDVKRGDRECLEALAVNPDRSMFAFRTDANKVKLISGKDWKVLARFSKMRGVCSASFIPNSWAVITGGFDGTISIWGIGGKEPLYTAQGHNRIVRCIVVSKNGKMVATGGQDSVVKIWDSFTLTLIASLTGHKGNINSVAFSDNGELVLTAADDGTVKLWHAKTGQLVRTIKAHADKVLCAIFSPKGERIYSSGNERAIKVWDRNTGDLVSESQSPFSPACVLALSCDGKILASGSLDGSIDLWNSFPLETRIPVTGHTGGIPAIVFGSDNKTIITRSSDRRIIVWDASTGAIRSVLSDLKSRFANVPWTSPDAVNPIAVSRDGKLIACPGANNNSIEIWDADKGILHYTLEGHEQFVSVLAFNPAGNILASGSADKTVRLWNLAKGSLMSTIRGSENTITCIEWDHKGERLVSVGYDSFIRMMDAKTGELLKSYPLKIADTNIKSATFNPSDDIIALADGHGSIIFLDVASGHVRSKIMTSPHSLLRVQYSPDGNTIAGISTNSVVFWDVHTGKRLTVINYRDASDYIWGYNTLTLSDDFSLLASLSMSLGINLWKLN
jgi:WD40 repeat protein